MTGWLVRRFELRWLDEDGIGRVWAFQLISTNN